MTHSECKFLSLAAIILGFGFGVVMPGRAQGPYADAPLSQLTLPAGAWITVRVNQPLSSDQNQPGDAFTGTLAQPLVVNGLVVARRGQTIGGRIAEALKAGRAKGTSRLGLELTEISIVDGQQLPVLTQLIEFQGGTSVGQDATAIATAAGIGAAIGAAADGGFGAGMGAIAGAAASTIGVLVTRGKPTVIYPESLLTFRTLAPLAIYTEQSEQAFQPVSQQDYEPQRLERRAARPVLAPRPYSSGTIYYGGPRVFIHSRPRFFSSYGSSVFVYSSPRYYPAYRTRISIERAPRFRQPRGFYYRRH
ncbi:MAG: hypothetical protein HY648_08480 [Acidobacteria bacterium]|nr:hypothetical protein [Acidobacteriota bacterium]